MQTRSGLILLAAAAAMALAAPLAAQVALPRLDRAGGALGGLGDRVLGGLDRSLATAQQPLGNLRRTAQDLLAARGERLAALVRHDRAALEFDASGDPARRGELVLTGADPAAIATATQAGFAVLGSETLPSLGLSVVRLAVPPGKSLAEAERALRQLLPEAEVSSDALHFPSGKAMSATGAGSVATTAPISASVGVIDGAPAGSGVAVRGFARGAPRPSDHGSAVVSLLQGAGVRRIAVADVYGADPAGGNALAIAQGLDWLVGQGIKVVSISLVGPRNALLARAVGAAQRQGVSIVAAVGNDGPAAPPAFPASYPAVIAVTGVDGRGRALIEAGRASHLDYAAPGADVVAATANGRWARVRGTSYAVPLVAARAAAALGRGPLLPLLDREAIDLGTPGPDAVYGRGLLCAACARRK